MEILGTKATVAIATTKRRETTALKGHVSLSCFLKNDPVINPGVGRAAVNPASVIDSAAVNPAPAIDPAVVEPVEQVQ